MRVDPPLLSRYKLQTFLACQRRFQLRFVTRLPWPASPYSDELQQSMARGLRFHRLLEQHYRGMTAILPDGSDEQVVRWWRTFQSHPPSLPNGDAFPEFNLSVLVGGMRLFGRIDLLILTEDEAHIVDWKTERQPRTKQALADDWQSRLYLSMLVAGGEAVGRQYRPEQVKMTYWFANAPEQSITLAYTQAAHAKTWAELTATAERIERRMAAPHAIWPLTDNLRHCRYCDYHAYCGRSPGTEAAPAVDWEMVADDSAENELTLAPPPP